MEHIMAKPELSERQQNILSYIATYIGDSGRPPTIREIGGATEITSTSVVNYNLNKLREKGYVARDAEVSRGLRLTDKAEELMGMPSVMQSESLVRLPMAGNIVAGEPISVGNDSFETYDDEDAIEVARSMLPARLNDLYALRVSGDSMIDAMVNDGDIVILHKQITASDGDMVAAWLVDDSTTTLKHFHAEPKEKRVRLQPANRTMDPIYVDPAQLEIQGKVVLVIRQA
jgi:repressor LexA